jgi:hypothetical protein
VKLEEGAVEKVFLMKPIVHSKVPGEKRPEENP